MIYLRYPAAWSVRAAHRAADRRARRTGELTPGCSLGGNKITCKTGTNLLEPTGPSRESRLPRSRFDIILIITYRTTVLLYRPSNKPIYRRTPRGLPTAIQLAAKPFAVSDSRPSGHGSHFPVRPRQCGGDRFHCSERARRRGAMAAGQKMPVRCVARNCASNLAAAGRQRKDRGAGVRPARQCPASRNFHDAPDPGIRGLVCPASRSIHFPEVTCRTTVSDGVAAPRHG